MKGIMKKLLTLCLPLEAVTVLLYLIFAAAKPEMAAFGMFLIYLGSIVVPTGPKEWMMEASTPIEKVKSVDARYLYALIYIALFGSLISFSRIGGGSTRNLGFDIFLPVVCLSVVFPPIMLSIEFRVKARGFLVGFFSGLLVYFLIAFDSSVVSGENEIFWFGLAAAAFALSWLLTRTVYKRRGEL